MTEPTPRTEARPSDLPRDANLRAGDRDRDAVAENLRTHHAEGRLDADELEERIDRCYHARTFGELETLLADLPRESRADDRQGWRGNWWRARLIALAPILVALAAISVLTGRHVIWLAVPLIFLTTRLRRHPERTHHGP